MVALVSAFLIGEAAELLGVSTDVDELDLRVGSLAVAVIKSTTVVVERDSHSSVHKGRSST